MKTSKLLVLTALWLFGLGASAYEQRTAPTAPSNSFKGDELANVDKTPQTFQADEYYVLYNKGAMKYFIAGNDWNTRASVNDAEAAALYFTQTTDALAKGADVYELKNFVPTKNAFMSAFADAADGIWTDNNTNGNRFWKVTQNGDDVRISNVTTEPALFLGWDASKNDTRTYLLASGSIDWQLYAAPGWKEYAAAKKVFDKSEELRAAIDKAMEVDEFDSNILDAAIDVYENLESTIEQMDAQIVAIMAALNSSVGEGASFDDPVNVTEALMQNADYSEGNNDGWSGDAPAVNTTVYNAEFFNKNYTYYQKILGAPAGVYSVKVRAFYRAGSSQESYNVKDIFANLNARLYAKTGAGEVRLPLKGLWAGAADNNLGYEADLVNIGDLFAPNTMATANAFFDADQNVNGAANYDQTLYFVMPDAEMNIGLKKTKQIANDWTLFDNWELNYHGNDASAYQQAFEANKEAYELPDEFTYVITTDYLDAFNNIAPTGATAEDVVAALNQLEAAYDTLTVNAQLWLELAEVAEEAKTVSINESLDETYRTPLGEWANYDFAEQQSDRKLTNEQLRALIKEKREAIVEAGKHVVTGNTDVTHLLTNPDYEQGATGWQGSPVMGTGGGNTCAEAYNRANFDIYQEVQGAPKGLYSIEVQGFFRLGRPKHENASTNSWQIWMNGQQKAPAFVYLNDVQTELKCIYEDPEAEPTDENPSIYTQANIDAPGDGNQYPNTMEQAAQGFAAGKFKSRAYGLVLNDGDQLRIGVKGSLDAASAGFEGANWAIWDNFKLTWVGYDAQYILPVIDEQMEKYNTLLNEYMGKTAYETLQARLNACAEAKTKDGKTMFDALGNLLKVDSLVRASIKKFAQLAAANDLLSQAINGFSTTCSQEASTNAENLAKEITALLPAHSIEDADVDAYIVKVNEAIAWLRVPVVPDEVSDENFFEMTTVINNADYSSNTGWSGTNFGYSANEANAEFFDKDFDHYQDLIGLPAGTYELSVQGFYRCGEIKQDYDSLQTNNEYGNNAYLYARAATSSDTTYFAKTLVRLAAEAEANVQVPTDEEELTEFNALYAGFAVAHADSTFLPGENEKTDTLVFNTYVANNMTAAASEFLNGKYNNSIIVKLPENGTLRIGLMKKAKVTHDWTMFDNWTLTYYGGNSAKEATPFDINIVGVETVEAAPSVLHTEMFTLDGRRTNHVQKGIMIVKSVMSDGTVKVKKIRR